MKKPPLTKYRRGLRFELAGSVASALRIRQDRGMCHFQPAYRHYLTKSRLFRKSFLTPLAQVQALSQPDNLARDRGQPVRVAPALPLQPVSVEGGRKSTFTVLLGRSDLSLRGHGEMVNRGRMKIRRM